MGGWANAAVWRELTAVVQLGPSGMARGGDGLGGLVSILERVSRTLDLMCRSALAESAGDAAARFGEASDGLHRALIALSEPHGCGDGLRPGFAGLAGGARGLNGSRAGRARPAPR